MFLYQWVFFKLIFQLECILSTFDKALSVSGSSFVTDFVRELLPLLCQCWGVESMAKIVLNKLQHLLVQHVPLLTPFHFFLWVRSLLVQSSSLSLLSQGGKWWFCGRYYIIFVAFVVDVGNSYCTGPVTCSFSFSAWGVASTRHTRGEAVWHPRHGLRATPRRGATQAGTCQAHLHKNEDWPRCSERLAEFKVYIHIFVLKEETLMDKIFILAFSWPTENFKNKRYITVRLSKSDAINQPAKV